MKTYQQLHSDPVAFPVSAKNLTWCKIPRNMPTLEIQVELDSGRPRGPKRDLLGGTRPEKIPCVYDFFA